MNDPVKILYSDKDMIVCVKPHGLSSEDGPGSFPELLRKLLRESLEAQAPGGAPAEIYTVHRLDRGAGGLMVYARSKKAAAALSAQFGSRGVTCRAVTKEYEALVYGEVTPAAARLTDHLFKDSSKNKVYAVKRPRKGVKEAVLSYVVTGSGAFAGRPFTRVRVALETGRTHQIRVQMASRGRPVLGDRKYGAGDDLGFIALESVKLSFSHPSSGEEMTFEVTPSFEDDARFVFHSTDSTKNLRYELSSSIMRGA